MSIQRDINGIIDHLLDQVDEVSKHKGLELEKKIKMTDMALRNVWKFASINLQYKKMMLLAPDIAKDKDVVLTLGKSAEPR